MAAMVIFRLILAILLANKTGATSTGFSYIPDTVNVPYVHNEDYAVWNDIDARCHVTVNETDDGICGACVGTESYEVRCNRCEVMPNSSHLLYAKDMTIWKKACASPVCSNTCPGLDCLPVGATVSVGVRCWHHQLPHTMYTAATFNIHSVVDTGVLAGCANLDVALEAGTLFTTNTTHCNTASVVCMTGYSPTESVGLTCCNGQWTGDRPACLKHCERLSVPHGTVSSDMTSHGSSVNISCSKGYSVSDPATLMCFNGSWSNDKPACNKDCKELSVSHGIVSSNNTAHGVQVDIECDENHSLLGSSTITCTNGFWSEESPLCHQVCHDNTFGEHCKTPCDCIINNTVTPQQSCHSLTGECQCLPIWTGKRCSIQCESAGCDRIPHADRNTGEKGELVLPLSLSFGILGILLVMAIVFLACWRRAKNRSQNTSKKDRQVSVIDILQSRRSEAPRLDASDDSNYCALTFKNPLSQNHQNKPLSSRNSITGSANHKGQMEIV